MAETMQVNFDDRGLVPAVCQDAVTGEVLMVAWMDAEALERTRTSGLATFWSRSRREMWVKGATSGNYLHVESVTPDCDGDTLLVKVRPDGPACHTGNRSCFFAASADIAAKALTLEDPFADRHMHTTWSDGGDSPRAMIEAAIAAGLARIGISDHSHTPFDPGYCMALEDYAAYQADIRALAAEYADRIEVLVGIEQDCTSLWQGAGFDYVIGSVHYVRVPGTASGTMVSPENPDGEYLPVDLDPETLALGIERFFDGDGLALAEAFFSQEADAVRATGCSIIGHFDLVKLFNRDADGRSGIFFDEDDPRYAAAWQRAADALLPCGVPFEINVSGAAKGLGECYPAPGIVAYLAERGARFVFSSDAHRAGRLAAHDARPELDVYRAIIAQARARAAAGLEA